MMNEILRGLPQLSGSAEGLHDSSGEFLKGDTEKWQKKWQDPNFIRAFPANVADFLHRDGHTEFLNKHQEVIHSAFSAFMALPWNYRETGYIAVNGMGFNKDGEVVPFATKQSTIDSLMRAEIASLLLLGFNPLNKKGTNDLIVESYQELITSRKDAFRNHIFRLITKNSAVRQWVGENNLDTQNGFSWDQDVTRLALSLIPQNYQRSDVKLYTLPSELKSLDLFPEGVIEEFVDFVLSYVKSFPKINPNRRDLTAFIFEVEKRPDKSRYEEKLKQLKDLLRSLR